MKYKVKLTFKYSDTLYVEADSEKEAIEKALPECCEQYESFYDANARTFVESDGIERLNQD